MKKINVLKMSAAVAVLFAIGCNKNSDKGMSEPQHPQVVSEEMMSENGANPDEMAVAENSATTSSQLNGRVTGSTGHYLYSESNAADGNHILIYKVRNNGSLEWAGSAASGGNGSGAGLGSQGALVIDKNHDWLFAVNAGSNSVSSFKINSDGGLSLAYTENTDGLMPVSVTVHGNLLYVLNRGNDRIHGFKIAGNGQLIHIKGSTQVLSGSAVDAPQISFSPNGDWIIVTEKATNIIGTFKVNPNGSVNSGIFTASTGPTPFGFDFSRDKFMIVSNAAGGAAGAGSATSYRIAPNGIPDDINGAVPNHQAAPCWFAVTKFGRFAYTTNTATNNVSSYYVAPWGGLYLVEGEAAKTENGPVDIVVAANNYFVYELNGKAASIGAYHRKFLGGLEFISTQSGLPSATTGLATW